MRAALLGYTVFGLQVGEECFTAADAEQTFKMYGPATNCKGGVGRTLGSRCLQDSSLYTSTRYHNLLHEELIHLNGVQ